MEYFELERAWEVVLDIGHSAPVRAIVEVDATVVSGGDDGYVFVRDHQGASLSPPAHCRAVRCLLPIDGTHLCLVGTRAGLVGLDLRTGVYGEIEGFDDVAVTAMVAADDVVAVGAGDGRVWTSTGGAGFVLLASLGAEVTGLAIVGDVIAAVGPFGVVALDHAGAEAWRHDTGVHPSVAAGPGSLVVAHHRSEPAQAVVEVFDADGGRRHGITCALPVVALAASGAGVDVLLIDGTVERRNAALDLVEVVASADPEGQPLTLAAGPGPRWIGWGDGSVRTADGSVVLPARSGGVYATTIDGDEDCVVAAVPGGLCRWNLRDGSSERTELPGACAVAFAGEQSPELVVAFLDASLERRPGFGVPEVAARGLLTDRPSGLGYFGGRIVATSRSGAEIVDADTLEASSLPRELLSGVARMEHRGAWFVGCGMLEGVNVAFVDGSGPIVHRPGLLAVPEELIDVVRIWDGAGFIDLGG